MFEFITNITQVVAQLTGWVDKKTQQTRKGAEECTMDAARITHNAIVESIKNENAVASSNLLKSVTVGSMQASTEMYSVTVGSSSPYASVVEYGRRAGGKQPPTQSIYQWMTQKGLEASMSGAYLIARKIGREGIPAKYVFQKGVTNAEKSLDAPLNALIEKNLRD
jgi:bacteriophage HK97-gp10 putative tail-component